VVEAKNGREALEMFAQGRCDLVISDYTMPEMRGDELAANLKQLAPSQPIIMLSASAGILDRSSLRVDVLLWKPFSVSELRQAIAQLC